MNSITNYAHDIFNLKLSEDKYYDFQLMNKFNFIKDNFNKLIDLKVTNNLINNWATWSESTNNFNDLNNYGLTAIDNGTTLNPFILNKDINYNLTNNPLISSNELKFELREVCGYLNNLKYVINVEDEIIKFRGGFLQGFYKLPNYNYQTLPNRFKKGWTISTNIRPITNFTENDTLNTRSKTKGYDNSGFLFYIGSRAENKFWNRFDGLHPDDKSIMKETTYEGVEEEGFKIPLNPPRIMVKEMHNQFLIYGRSNGSSIHPTHSNNPDFGFATKTADDIDQNAPLIYKTPVPLNNISEVNPFLKYGRSDGAPRVGNHENPHVDYVDSEGNEYDYGTQIADDDESNYDLSDELDYTKDITDNAIGFRITEDGRIGYRRIVSVNCDVSIKFEIKEDYTEPNTIINNVFNDITIKWVADKDLTSEDDEPRNGELLIYLNGKLIKIFKDFEEIINRELNEHKDKQLGVPFNISVGGGTQGLSESLTFDGPDPSDADLPLEKNFAGSFIGDMKNFIMYDSPLSWISIKK